MKSSSPLCLLHFPSLKLRPYPFSVQLFVSSDLGSCSVSTLAPRPAPHPRSRLGPFFNSSVSNRKHACGSPLSIPEPAFYSTQEVHLLVPSQHQSLVLGDVYAQSSAETASFADVRQLWTGWLFCTTVLHMPCPDRFPWAPCTKAPSTVGLVDKRNDKSGRTLQLPCFQLSSNNFQPKTS